MMPLRTSGAWTSHSSDASWLSMRAGSGCSPAPLRWSMSSSGREQVQAGIEILRPYFDQIILDLPHDLDATTVAALEASDTIFFLVSQNVPPSA